ncbi:FAD-dependent oxidoreductase [Actinoplanes sp. NPDC049596]|uniref:FAD-dependent oxidoreductase n=1 Tax=unclassified Actinoplanes TaxID=2626549 RepID=UPI0034475CE9
MDIIVIGAGPTGSFLSLSLARRGHAVTVVDRDPGPGPDGTWARSGVMQFRHPHGLRSQVVDALRAELPDVLGLLATSGGYFAEGALGVRRSVYERVLHGALTRESGVTMLTDSARDVRPADDGRLVLLRDGGTSTADLVVNATGRARFLRERRSAGLDNDTGLAYASREYQMTPEAHGKLITGARLAWTFPGYFVRIFPHDNDIISTLFIRRADDHDLLVLRDEDAYEAATAAVPPVAAVMASGLIRPISGVNAGGRMRNIYRGQLSSSGEIETPGVIHVGDAVFSPSPMWGRGIATSLMQAQALLGLVDAGHDRVTMTREFDAWCQENMFPWFEDQRRDDAVLPALWDDSDLTVDGSLPSRIITLAVAEDPQFKELIAQYMDMRVLPSALAVAEPAARERVAAGWRPPLAEGPDRRELLRLINSRTGREDSAISDTIPASPGEGTV